MISKSLLAEAPPRTMLSEYFPMQKVSENGTLINKYIYEYTARMTMSESGTNSRKDY